MKLLNRRRGKRHGRRFWKVLNVKGRLCMRRSVGEQKRKEIYRRHMRYEKQG